MSLVVEDGTGKADATSYVSAADAQAWASARGLSFTGNDAAVEKHLLLAMDYVESFRARFKGSKTTSEQALQWPRTGVVLDSVELTDDTIPAELKSAVIQLAFESQTTDLQPSGTGQEVLREKVGPIETQYAERGSGTLRPQFNKAMAFLEPLLRSGGFGISTLRV